MESLSPKMEIINYFDSLINRIDVDIEECIEKHRGKQVLGETNCYRVENRHLRDKTSLRDDSKFTIDIFKLSEKIGKNDDDSRWSESTNVFDYLNQVRQKTIDELRKGQNDAVNKLKLNSESFEEINEMKSRLFADKFYFQVAYNPCERMYQGAWIFNVFTIVADFYLSPSDIELLDKLINFSEEATKYYIRDSGLILDEKMILIGSIKEYFLENLNSKQFPSHMIHIKKQDLLDIKQIKLSYSVSRVDFAASLIGLFNLERLVLDMDSFENLQTINLEGLSSLNYLSARVYSIDRIVIGNLNALKTLSIKVTRRLNSESNKKMFSDIFNKCPNIEHLFLFGDFPNDLNFDGLTYLKDLSLNSLTIDRFNYNIFNSLFNRLHKLSIAFPCIGIDKSFFSQHFENLSELAIRLSPIYVKLEKRMFDGFPALQSLVLSGIELKEIDPDVFSNLTNLKVLDLSQNILLDLDPEMFASLGNLESLNLSYNYLSEFQVGIFDHIPKIEEIDLRMNSIRNQQVNKILNRVKNSNITVLNCLYYF